MEPIDAFDSSTVALPVSKDFLPSTEPIEEKSIVDESIALRNLTVEEVMPMSEILDKPLVRMPLLNEITHAFPKAITRFVDTPTQGLSLKLITPVALDFVSQAGMRNSTFRMSWNPFLDERKMIPMSVYDNLDVDITGIQYDSRLIPPDKFFERLLDRVQPYMHMIFFVGVTQNLHCWNSQIKFYAQSGLLNFAYHMFAEMCDQGVLS
ncbi:hypothetical protein L195_g055830, partial [Trifolium pratense]